MYFLFCPLYFYIKSGIHRDMFQLTWFFSLEGVRKHLKQPVPGEPPVFFIGSYLPYSVVLVSVTQPGESATVVTVQSFSHV